MNVGNVLDTFLKNKNRNRQQLRQAEEQTNLQKEEHESVLRQTLEKVRAEQPRTSAEMRKLYSQVKTASQLSVRFFQHWFFRDESKPFASRVISNQNIKFVFPIVPHEPRAVSYSNSRPHLQKRSYLYYPRLGRGRTKLFF